MAAAGGSGAGAQTSQRGPSCGTRVTVMERQGYEHGGGPLQLPLRALCLQLTK